MAPAVSQAQARFFCAVAGGKLKKPGLPKSKAKEFLRGVDVATLPTRKAKRSLQSALGY